MTDDKQDNASPHDDGPASQGILDTLLAHPRWLGVTGIATIIALAVAILAAVGIFSSDRSGTSRSSEPNSAVEEIAKRPLWSSTPITYSEANKAIGSHEPLPRGNGAAGEESEALAAPPKAISATQFAKEPEHYVRTGPYEFEAGSVVVVVGKILSAEALTSRFLGTKPEGGSSLRPITQVKLQVLERSDAVYAEFPENKATVGSVVIVLGWVAAVGSTDRNTVKAAYLLAGQAETLEPSVDSKRLRELYDEAWRGKTNTQIEREREEKEEKELKQAERKGRTGSGSGISLFP